MSGQIIIFFAYDLFRCPHCKTLQKTSVKKENGNCCLNWKRAAYPKTSGIQEKKTPDQEGRKLHQLTCFPAPAELDSTQVKQVHAVQIVVYEELQQVGDVALVGLVTLVHHCSALQQLTHPTTNKLVHQKRCLPLMVQKPPTHLLIKENYMHLAVISPQLHRLSLCR